MNAVISNIINNLGIGKIFGGFVRDTVAGLPFKDIDIWFKSSEESSVLVDYLTENYGLTLNMFEIERRKHQHQDQSGYSFNRTQYNLFYRETNNCGSVSERKVLFLDLIVSTSFPVDDFESNTLVLDSNGINRFDNDISKYLEVLSDINNRIMRIIPGSSKYSDQNIKSGILGQKQRCLKFIDKEWSIFKEDGVQLYPSLSNKKKR